MKNNILLKIGTSAAVVALLTNQACKVNNKEVSPIDLIIGDWKILELDGDKYFIENDDYVYFQSMEAMTNGNLEWCYNYQYPLNPQDNNKVCYKGLTWEWISAEESLLKITANGDTNTIKLIFPTNDIMNWDEIQGDYFGANSIKFERID